MTTDEQLRQDVTDELFWDPKVNSDTIAVRADDGTVTMRGAVGSPREKHAARKAVERVSGVLRVVSDLEVTTSGARTRSSGATCSGRSR
jgi:osmotically-inducible protein OsmY